MQARSRAENLEQALAHSATQHRLSEAKALEAQQHSQQQGVRHSPGMLTCDAKPSVCVHFFVGIID